MIPCPACRRHLRASERACPFCSVAMPLRPKPVPPMRGRALRREVLLFATTLAAVGCGSNVDEPTPTVDAATDAKADSGSGFDVEPDTNLPVPDTSMIDDTGGGVPLYGGAPPPP